MDVSGTLDLSPYNVGHDYCATLNWRNIKPISLQNDFLKTELNIIPEVDCMEDDAKNGCKEVYTMMHCSSIRSFKHFYRDATKEQYIEMYFPSRIVFLTQEEGNLWQ